MLTLQQISKMYDISIYKLRRKTKKYKINPSKTSKLGKARLYSEKSVNILIQEEPKLKIPKVIYVTQTFWVIPSKMNYD